MLAHSNLSTASLKLVHVFRAVVVLCFCVLRSNGAVAGEYVGCNNVKHVHGSVDAVDIWRREGFGNRKVEPAAGVLGHWPRLLQQPWTLRRLCSRQSVLVFQGFYASVLLLAN